MPLRKTPVELNRRAPSEVRTAPAKLAAKSLAPGASRKRVVIVGAAEDLPRALQHPAVEGERFEVVAALALDFERDDHVRARETIAGILRDTRPETILVAGPVGAATMRAIADLALLYHSELLAVMPAEVLAGHYPVIVWSGDSPLVQLARPPRRSWEANVKRAFDVCVAAIGLMVTAPLLGLLAIAIQLESPGHWLFEHERLGRHGRRFRCLKLRTMRTDAEIQLRSDDELYDLYRRHHYKIPDELDPRVTALGRWLRRTSLDEVPQLWNVLMGEMSLVGPRPVVAEELSVYDESARELLVSVRPGITGAWAVSGRHGVGYPHRCDIELSYVRHWSLRGDVRILASTFRAVVSPGGDAAFD